MMTSKTIAPIMTLTVAALALAACGGSSSSSSCTINGVDCSVVNAANSAPKTVDTKAIASFDAAAQKFTAVGDEGTYTFARSDLAAGNAYQYDLGIATGQTINGKIYNLAFGRGAKSDFVGFGGASSSGVFLGQAGYVTLPNIRTGKVNYSGLSYVATSAMSGGATQVKSNLVVDFDAGTVKENGGTLGIDATISNGTFVTGKSSFAGNVGTFNGKFYGGNEMNGVATDNSNYVAVVTTTQQ